MSHASHHDLLVQSRFKNLILWEAMAGRSSKECSNGASVTPTTFSAILNLKTSPFTRGGCTAERKYTEIANKIAAFFCLPPEYLFPESLYSLRLPSLVERTYSSIEVAPLMAASKMPALLGNPQDESEAEERAAIVKKVIHTLPPREEMTIRLRLGLYDGHEYTLKEVADHFSVTTERARQIEARAIKKLRHPSRSNILLATIDPKGNFCELCHRKLRVGVCQNSSCRAHIEVEKRRTA